MHLARPLRGLVAAGASVALATAAGACEDLFHSTSWSTACDSEAHACATGSAGAASGGAGGDGAGQLGGASNGAAGDGAGAASSTTGQGGAGACGSAVEDCTTPGDDDCNGQPNDGCDLVLYLAFDEGSGTTMVDSSGNGNSGTHDATYVPGKKGTALAFDGKAMGTVPASPKLSWGKNNADFTVAYWLRVTAPPPGEWRGLLHHGTTNCSPGDRTSAHFIAPMEEKVHSALSTTLVDPMGACDQEVINTSELVQGVWTHVASVKSGSTHTMYVDGKPDGSSQIQPVIGNEAPLYVGKDPWYLGMTGEIDELQVYGHALSDVEIAALAK